MPTDENRLRNRPEHWGHSDSGASVKDWTVSNSWPHAVHAYWYVGIIVLLKLLAPASAGAGQACSRRLPSLR
jgi:hypothetical protein